MLKFFKKKLLLVFKVCTVMMIVSINTAAAQTLKITNNGMNPKIVSTIGKSTQEFVELVDAAMERDRLGLRTHVWSDFVPTGFYLAPNTSLKIEVTQLKGESTPSLIIGTFNLFENKQPQIEKLKVGANTIKANEKGGLVWVRYTAKQPGGQVRINFVSGHVNAPTFIKGETSSASWVTQLKNSKSTDVLLLGNNVMQVYSLKYAKSIQNQDNNYVLQTADNIWNWQNEFSGMDGSTALNKPHAHNRILMVETANIQAGAYASMYGTAYGPNTTAGAFTKEIAKEAWGTWHELGHEKQQLMWTWSNLGEVTVNLYSLHAERKLGISPGRLHEEKRFGAAFDFILSNNPNKDFNTMTDSYDDHFTRVVMFHQLYLAFGEKFYIEIHKRARLEKRDTKMSDLDKQQWFVRTACKVSGKDLTDFFKKWGFRLGNGFYQEIASLKLPKPAMDITMLQDVKPETTITNNAIYKIGSAQNHRLAFDLNNTKVSLYGFHGGKNQQWKVTRTSDGYYTIYSERDQERVLEVPNSNYVAGTKVTHGVYTNTDNQKWKIVHVVNGEYTLSPKGAPHLYLDLMVDKVTSGTEMVLKKQVNGRKQRFYFNKL